MNPKSGQVVEVRVPIDRFARFCGGASIWLGSKWAFVSAGAVIVLWATTGPLFHYSDTWQLIINTGTTIVTFLMVFLIQRAQNKDALAVHLKLNEIVAAIHGASNRLIDVEDMSEADLVKLHRFYKRLAEMSKRDFEIGQSHSVEEADALHHRKRKVASPTGTATSDPTG